MTPEEFVKRADASSDVWAIYDEFYELLNEGFDLPYAMAKALAKYDA
jgi:hypothetical protein